MHVYHWGAGYEDRYPLAEGACVWSQYLAEVAKSGRDHFAMIEFVKGDDPAMFRADARTLTDWVSNL